MKRVAVKQVWQAGQAGAVRGLQVDAPTLYGILEDEACIRVAGRVVLADGAVDAALVAVDQAGGEHRADLRPRNESGVASGSDFDFELPSGTRAAKVELSLGGGREALFDLAVATIFKVQRGREGHLFLDNDTNRSVDQFTGRLLLDDAQRDLWRSYMHAAAALQADGCVFRLLVAPVKEEVFSDLYPHPRAPTTALDQVLEACRGPLLVFPLDALREKRDDAYSTVDTHWSDYGARVAAGAYLSSIGLADAAAAMPAAFVARQVYGDLGGKVEGGQAGVFQSLEKAYRFSQPSFDNGIGNHGRIWTYRNGDAPVDATLVLFGDSFSVPLAAILASVFSRLVYCYTAAGIDQEVLALERPRYVLAQLNQRFAINAPRAGASVFRQVADKLKALPAAERERIRQRMLEESAEPAYAARMLQFLSAATGG